jgi:hypothetical protein
MIRTEETMEDLRVRLWASDAAGRMCEHELIALDRRYNNLRWASVFIAVVGLVGWVLALVKAGQVRGWWG